MGAHSLATPDSNFEHIEALQIARLVDESLEQSPTARVARHGMAVALLAAILAIPITIQLLH